MSARDKARLDWMTRNAVSLEKDTYLWAVLGSRVTLLGVGSTPRQAIDAAMREDARREKGARE